MCGDEPHFYVAGVKFHEKAKAPAIVLQNEKSGVAFGIIVNKHAARMMLAVLDAAGRERYTRPLSHDFILAVAKAAGASFGRVIIDRLNADGSFGATAEICAADGRVIARVDARPSDALPVAVSGNVPILVTPEVARKAASFYSDLSPYREIRPEDLDFPAD